WSDIGSSARTARAFTAASIAADFAHDCGSVERTSTCASAGAGKMSARARRRRIGSARYRISIEAFLPRAHLVCNQEAHMSRLMLGAALALVAAGCGMDFGSGDGTGTSAQSENSGGSGANSCTNQSLGGPNDCKG